jgi:hypothetical protein
MIVLMKMRGTADRKNRRRPLRTSKVGRKTPRDREYPKATQQSTALLESLLAGFKLRASERARVRLVLLVVPGLWQVPGSAGQCQWQAAI